MPLQDFIEMPSAAAVSVALEPAQNALHSLVLLAKAEDISGLSDWVNSTASALTPTERRQHKLVTIGLHYAMLPEQSASSFPAYLDHLAARHPQALLDKMLAAYAQISPLSDREKQVWYDEPAPSK